ncbi:unnamed protein product [Brugia timori]|uniref:Bm429 n=2 Tax=Brugia TaxID=6278 RepID=A0A1I9G1T1_BRUMA|nr:Bm429 [Brugia malayi]VDO18048.1 unnamed protein product [Brugia timori]
MHPYQREQHNGKGRVLFPAASILSFFFFVYPSKFELVFSLIIFWICS